MGKLHHTNPRGSYFQCRGGPVICIDPEHPHYGRCFMVNTMPTTDSQVFHSLLPDPHYPKIDDSTLSDAAYTFGDETNYPAFDFTCTCETCSAFKGKPS